MEIEQFIRRFAYLPNRLAVLLYNRHIKSGENRKYSVGAYKRQKSRLCPGISKRYYMLRARGIARFAKELRGRMQRAGWEPIYSRNYFGGIFYFKKIIKEEGKRIRRLYATFKVHRDIKERKLGTPPFRLFIYEKKRKGRQYEKDLLFITNSFAWKKLIEKTLKRPATPNMKRKWRRYLYYKELPALYGVLNERVVMANRMAALLEYKYF